MAEIIYAKYNKLRRKEFRISTLIFEEEGQRWVEKRPLCPEAQAHLDRMAEIGAKLEKAYPRIQFVKAEKTETGVRFPYLTGVTIDSLLAQSLSSGERLVDSFEELFQWILPADRPAELVNLDCNLDNFLVENGRIVCLDYEWVFGSEVSVDFLVYRVIHYFYGTHPEAERLIAERDLLARFGIGEKSLISYEAKEKLFQQHVFGEQENARYTDSYRQPIIDLAGLASQLDRQKREIDELRKVVGHYQQIEGKLRKIGLWQLLQGIQKIGRKIRQIVKK